MTNSLSVDLDKVFTYMDPYTTWEIYNYDDAST